MAAVTHSSNVISYLQDRIAQLELDLEEERQTGDQLMDRVDRGREQVHTQHIFHYRCTPDRLLMFSQTCLCSTSVCK